MTVRTAAWVVGGIAFISLMLLFFWVGDALHISGSSRNLGLFLVATVYLAMHAALAFSRMVNEGSWHVDLSPVERSERDTWFWGLVFYAVFAALVERAFLGTHGLVTVLAYAMGLAGALVIGFVGSQLHQVGAVSWNAKEERYSSAYQNYREAAVRGDSRTMQFCLGVMFGDWWHGVPADEKQIAAAVRGKADRGDSHAQAIMGDLCASGQGVPQDSVEALKWMAIAEWSSPSLSRGTADLRERLGALQAASRDALSQTVPPAQFAEAQERAIEWAAELVARYK